MPDIVCLNGELMPPQDATVPIGDRGFLYGDALFETLRAYGGTVFRLDAHLARFRSAAELLVFPHEPTDAQLADLVRRTLAASDYADAYLRLTVTRGVGRGLSTTPRGAPTVLVEARAFHPYDARLYREGVRLIVSRFGRGTESPLAALKLTNYLPAIMAKREAALAGADDALTLDARGRVAEATVSNLVIVSDGRVLTPPVDTGVLPGITRAVILEVCHAAGIPCAERPLEIGDVLGAQEAFLTNTLMEVLPVRSLGRTRIGDAVPGPVTADLAARFKALVARETGPAS